MRAPRSIIEAEKHLTDEQKKVREDADSALLAYATQKLTEVEAQEKVDAWNSITPTKGMGAVAPRAFLKHVCAVDHPHYNQ